MNNDLPQQILEWYFVYKEPNPFPKGLLINPSSHWAVNWLLPVDLQEHECPQQMLWWKSFCRHCCVRVQQVPNCSTNLRACSKIWVEPSLTCDCTSFTTTIHHFHTNTIKIISIKHHILNRLLGSCHGYIVSVAIWMGDFTNKKTREESWNWFSVRLVRTVI